MMDFKEFAEVVSKEVRVRSDGAFNTLITSQLKNNGTKLTGISGIAIGSNGGPCIYLDTYYKWYKNGGIGLQGVIDEVYRQITVHQDDLRNVNAADFLDWERVRSRIYAKLVNAEKNKGQLGMVPHRIFLDLAVVYYVAVSGIGEHGNGAGTIMVQNSHLPIWEQDEEGLYQSAIANMRSDGKPVFDDMGTVLRGFEPKGIGLCSNKEVPLGTGMYILTNNRQYYGASEILDKNTLRGISDRIKGDFIILPSSVHEVIVLSLNFGFGYRELSDMVQEVNATEVSADEYLSDHVYVYVRSEETLKLAA